MASTTNDVGAYVYVSYPRTADIKFNTDYYINKHCALVDKHWKQFGLKSCTVVQFAEDDPSGIHTQAILLWDSAEDFDKAIGANIPELMQDLPNYSNVTPIFYHAKVLRLA